MLCDTFPMWRRIDKGLNSKVKRNLSEVCDFPIRGKMIIDEPVMAEVEEGIGKRDTEWWLIEDDIED